MDKYDTLEYSWVKATTVSIHLWIYLFLLSNTNKGLGTSRASEAHGLLGAAQWVPRYCPLLQQGHA
jgi:hypothetical protein